MPERAICVGLWSGQGQADQQEAERSMAELAELADAAGAEVVAEAIQHRTSPEPATYIGKGKLEEVKQICDSEEIDLAIFNAELSGSQIRNIEKIAGCRVVDRTMLILDIFAAHAKSKEGKLQVELAQLQYRLSHLTGQGLALSRLGGGIGTRGPGETQLETDRRHIYRKIVYLKNALTKVSENRQRMREKRQREDIKVYAVVGYTNAGKSTLINQLCQTSLLTADQVFATLDPSVRRLTLPDSSTVLLVDTVGFIRQLPHHLIDAFHSTLDEVRLADAIIQVVDITDPDIQQQMEVVEQQLEYLEAASKKRLLVFNKIDEYQPPLDSGSHLPDGMNLTQLSRQQAPRFLVSAETGAGLEQLLQALVELNQADQLTARVLIPYDQAQWLDYVRQHGTIDVIDYQTDGIHVLMHLPHSRFAPLRRFLQLAQSGQEG